MARDIFTERIAGMLKSYAKGRFVIKHILGEGVSGRVVLVRDTRLGVDRALKVFEPRFIQKSKTLRKRFDDEAKIMAQLERLTIVRVYDVVDCEYDGDQWKFLVMELLTGGSVFDHIFQYGKMHPRQAVQVMLDVLDALEAAHQKGIVHRDIKPENIMFSSKGEVKLADFGIAHAPSEKTRLTKLGSTLGTEAYMPPEQHADGSSVTPRSDIYAMGVLLWAMLTSKHPGRLDFYISVEREQDWFDGIPGGLESVIRIATSEDPNHRYESASAMTQVLCQIIEGLDPLPDDVPKLGSALEEAKRVRARSLLPQPVEDGEHGRDGQTMVPPSPSSICASAGLKMVDPSVRRSFPQPSSPNTFILDEGKDEEEGSDSSELPESGPHTGTLTDGNYSDDSRRPITETRFGDMRAEAGRKARRNFVILLVVFSILVMLFIGAIAGVRMVLSNDEDQPTKTPPTEVVSKVVIEPMEPEDLVEIDEAPQVAPIDSPKLTAEVVQEEIDTTTSTPQTEPKPAPREIKAKVVPPTNDRKPPKVKESKVEGPTSAPEEFVPAQKGTVRLIPKQVMEVDDPEAPDGKRDGIITYVLTGTDGQVYTLTSSRRMAQVPYGTYTAQVSFEGRSQNQAAGSITVEAPLTTVGCYYTVANCKTE
jgi:serine/threonine protein kinase